jgi:hypothetical protein
VSTGVDVVLQQRLFTVSRESGVCFGGKKGVNWGNRGLCWNNANGATEIRAGFAVPWMCRRKTLLDGLEDSRGYSHLEEEALDRTMWRNRFGRGFGPVVRQNTE